MKRILGLLLLSTALPASAGLTLFADGVVISGCNDCTSTGAFDPFNLGANTDLTGQSYRVIYELSDAALAVTPVTTMAGAQRYNLPETPGYISAALEMNSLHYDLPLAPSSLVLPSFEFALDSSFGATYVHEQTSDFINSSNFVYTKSDLIAYGGDHATFGSHREVYSNGTHSQAWGMQFYGTLGEFTVLQTPPRQVPEPGTLGLFGIGLAGLLWSRRSKMKT